MPLNAHATLRREPREGPPRIWVALWEPGRAPAFNGTADVTRRGAAAPRGVTDRQAPAGVRRGGFSGGQRDG